MEKNNNQLVLFTIILLLVIAIIFLVISGFGYNNMMGNNYYGYGMMSSFYSPFIVIFGWIFMILVLVALTLFIVWMVKQLQHGEGKK